MKCVVIFCLASSPTTACGTSILTCLKSRRIPQSVGIPIALTTTPASFVPAFRMLILEISPRKKVTFEPCFPWNISARLFSLRYWAQTFVNPNAARRLIRADPMNPVAPRTSILVCFWRAVNLVFMCFGLPSCCRFSSARVLGGGGKEARRPTVERNAAADLGRRCWGYRV